MIQTEERARLFCRVLSKSVTKAVFRHKRLTAIANVHFGSKGRRRCRIKCRQLRLRKKRIIKFSSRSLNLRHRKLESACVVFFETDVGYLDSCWEEIRKSGYRVAFVIEPVAGSEISVAVIEPFAIRVTLSVRIAEIGRSHHRRSHSHVYNMD